MSRLELQLVRSVLAAFLDMDPRGETPILSAWRRMTDHLRSDEAVQLPGAVAAVTPLLLEDPDRLRLALDLITTFDLVEVLPTLLRLVAESSQAQILLAAASLSTNPAADPDAGGVVRSAAIGSGASRMESRALAIRLDPGETPSTDLEALLRAQSWPGGRSSEEGVAVAPRILLDESTGPQDFRWRFAGDLYEAGAAVRRLPAVWKRQPSPAWLGNSAIVVTWTNAAVARLRQADPRITLSQFIMAAQPESPASRMKLLSQVAQHPRIIGRLRLPGRPESEASIDPLRPDLYKLGSFDTREMLFLAGVSRPVMQRVRDELRPRVVRAVPYWSFNQLVGLRTWQFFRARADSHRFPTTVLKALVEFAGATQPTRVGVTGAGEVLVESDGRFVDWLSGQEAMAPFVLLDEVFQPVELGEGRIPSLLDPSLFTRVHPAILGGTPRIVGFRISARAVAGMVEEHGDIAVRQAYPDLTDSQIADAAQLGGELLHAA